MSAAAIFSATAALARKLTRARRFDRVRASRTMYRRVHAYWLGGVDAIFEHLSENHGWDRLHERASLAAIGQTRKALSDADRKLLLDLLGSYAPFADAQQVAHAIIEAASLPTFEQASTFALRQIGVRSANFELRNELILDRLMERSTAHVFATRHHMDQVFETITHRFYELGNNPYDSEFLAELKSELAYKTTWETKRFALTETGIAAEMAQAETFRRNGVQRKRWNAIGQNTRLSHAELDGVEVGIDEAFLVGDVPAQHPLDPNLPPGELVNCHCWVSPVVDDDFQIDPERIWEGQ